MMISPCGDCNPHLASALMCYFSFFLSSSSFFLYWYWLSCYRQEQSREPLVKSESCHNPDCENCYCNGGFGGTATASTSCYSASSSAGVDNPGVVGLENEGCPSMIGGDSYSDLEPLDDQHHHHYHHNCGGACGGFDVTDSVEATSPLEDFNDNDDMLSRIVRGDEGEEEERDEIDVEDQDDKPCPVSNNPYLPGNSMTHNVLWGLQGMLVNLVEAILAAIFYTGIFENNLATTLTWCIGFSINFLCGNIMHTLLLVFCTNRKKLKELWVRWALELVFNTVKDLYFLWIGLALLDYIVRKSATK